MVNIRKYQMTDRYKLEELIGYYYAENKLPPPSPENIVTTIGVLTSFSQCGSIYMFEYDKEVVGYAIVNNIWNNRYAKITYYVDEVYILKSYRKYKLGVNFFENLIKDDGVYEILGSLDNIKSISKKGVKSLKFNESKRKIYIRNLIQ